MRFKLIDLLMLLLVMGSSRAEVEPSPCCNGDNVLSYGGCLARSKDNTQKIHVLLECAAGMYTIDPSADPTDEYEIDDYGTLITNNGSMAVEAGKYCIVKKNIQNTDNENATIADGTIMVEMAMACFPDDEEKFLAYTISGSLILTSVVFLVLTLIVYFLVSELRDLQGKCIMCTCICLCLGFCHLGIAQLFYLAPLMCSFIAFGTYFWMMATFFWMNVVSINVMKCVVFRKSDMTDRRTFQIYSAYGWGVPLIFLISTYIAHKTEGDHIKPGFGNNACWFTEKVATWGYFYGPILVILILNVLLFLITSHKLWNKTSYNNVSKIRSLKYKFVLYLKLFLVMGISWLFEIISFIHDGRHIVWMIADAFNCLQGVVFFLVLIAFRKRALRGLAERGLLPVPCIPKGPRVADEECEEIMEEEESPAMMAPA
ncbi:G-protein coupled receptor Mth2-like [Arctopsyche grandis]|uniref:G-protein coupled receptor Mth2-like n=1 Tax=Arctopsyche grandis TaxID=121162 RepID=UPI00406D8997